MIREILDCSLIKKMFLDSSIEEIIVSYQEEENLEKMCQYICQIMNEDDFFLSDDQLIRKLDEFIYCTRFSKKHSSNIIYLENQIIIQLRQYKSMSALEKSYARKAFIGEEVTTRDLSFFYNREDCMHLIHNFIRRDYDNIINLLHFTYHGMNYEEVCSVINLLKNRYPELLVENTKIYNAISSILIYMRTNRIYQNPILEFFCQNKLKKTEKKLENLQGNSYIKK